MRIETSIRAEIEDLLTAIQQCAMAVSPSDRARDAYTAPDEALLESILEDADRCKELLDLLNPA